MGRLLVSASVVLGACSSDLSGGPTPRCGEVTCEAGQVCLGRACRQLCESSGQCPAGFVCDGSACLPAVSSGEAPAITAIDGTGTPDSAAGHGARHLTHRLVVTGQRLAQAQVTLAAGGVTHTLESCEPPTDTRLVLSLPAELTAQSYTLTAANQAGACSATVTLLQGEPGSLEASGAQLIGSINGALEGDASLRVGGHVGANLLANPYFTQRTNLLPSYWTLATDGTSAPRLVDVSADAPAGPLALENGAATRLTATSTGTKLLNQNATYAVEATLKDATSGGTLGKAVVGVRLYDAAGSEIRGSGESGWWLEVANLTPPSAWTRYHASFGAQTQIPFPAQARSMTVSVMLNTDASGIGNRLLRAQGLSLREEPARESRPWFVAGGTSADGYVAQQAGTWLYITGLTDVRGSAASSYDPASGRFTAPEAGLYLCGLQGYKSYSAAGYYHVISTCFAPPSFGEAPCNGFTTYDYTLSGQGGGGYDDSTPRHQGLVWLPAGHQIGYRTYSQLANDYAFYRPYSRMYCAKLSD